MCVDFTVRKPKKVIVLDGAYSFRPELEKLVDLSVLVEVPADECHRRLNRRESKDFLDQWHKRWDAVEAYYYGNLRPANLFNLVVPNQGSQPRFHVPFAKQMTVPRTGLPRMLSAQNSC